jgi:hypothetical protein
MKPGEHIAAADRFSGSVPLSLEAAHHLISLSISTQEGQYENSQLFP